MAKAALIVGLVGVVIALGVVAVSLLLPVLSDGRTSWDEAMLGIIPGAVCFFLSLIMSLIGLVMFLTQKKETD